MKTPIEIKIQGIIDRFKHHLPHSLHLAHPVTTINFQHYTSDSSMVETKCILTHIFHEIFFRQVVKPCFARLYP